MRDTAPHPAYEERRENGDRYEWDACHGSFRNASYWSHHGDFDVIMGACKQCTAEWEERQRLDAALSRLRAKRPLRVPRQASPWRRR